MSIFELKLENEIKYAFFFTGENKITDDDLLDIDDQVNRFKNLLKKNYILVTKDNKIIIKNLGIRKKSVSKLSREIFWHHMVPEIIKTGQCKFSKAWITKKINELLAKDYKLAAIRYDVGDISEYSKSPNGIYAQIAQKHGSGIFFMIPNLKSIGVGKGKSYATYQEFIANKLTVKDIDLENIYAELEYFTLVPITKNIFEY